VTEESPQIDPSSSEIYAEPRVTGSGWYVFWETSSAYGARGRGLTEAQAIDLAARIRTGEERV
jgi:hypothetical protein